MAGKKNLREAIVTDDSVCNTGKGIKRRKRKFGMKRDKQRENGYEEGREMGSGRSKFNNGIWIL